MEGLPLEDARRIARAVVENPAWCECVRGNASGDTPQSLPATVREFFQHYRAVKGRFCDLCLVAAEVAPPQIKAGLVRIGSEDGHTELCVGQGDVLYRIGNDVPVEEALESSVPSVYHAVVHLAALLEYVSIPVSSTGA